MKFETSRGSFLTDSNLTDAKDFFLTYITSDLHITVRRKDSISFRPAYDYRKLIFITISTSKMMAVISKFISHAVLYFYLALM